METRPQRRVCTFHVRCPGARHVYLSGGFADGQRPLVVPLRPAAGGVWNARLSLRPGTYRFRFYVDDGHLLTWFHPPGPPRGWDEVLVVPADERPRDRPAARRSAGEAAAASRCLRDAPDGGDAAWVDVSPVAACDPPARQATRPGA